VKHVKKAIGTIIGALRGGAKRIDGARKDPDTYVWIGLVALAAGAGFYVAWPVGLIVGGGLLFPLGLWLSAGRPFFTIGMRAGGRGRDRGNDGGE
jgi:hypothetical protein